MSQQVPFEKSREYIVLSQWLHIFLHHDSWRKNVHTSAYFLTRQSCSQSFLTDASKKKKSHTILIHVKLIAYSKMSWNFVFTYSSVLLLTAAACIVNHLSSWCHFVLKFFLLTQPFNAVTVLSITFHNIFGQFDG